MIRTEPAAGTVAAAGATVNLVVSSGPAEEPVPAVVGLSEANAISELQGAGFDPNVTENEVGDQAQDGRVIRQNPEGDTPAPLGSEVDIVVGRFVQSDEGGGDGQRRRWLTTGAQSDLIEEPSEEVVSAHGEDRLGMELHTLHRVLAVSQSHHDTVVGLGGDVEAVRDGAPVDDQGVIAGRLERVG